MRRVKEVGLNDKPLIEGKVTLTFDVETQSDLELIELYKYIHQYMHARDFNTKDHQLLNKLRRNFIHPSSHPA